MTRKLRKLLANNALDLCGQVADYRCQKAGIDPFALAKEFGLKRRKYKHVFSKALIKSLAGYGLYQSNN